MTKKIAFLTFTTFVLTTSTVSIADFTYTDFSNVNEIVYIEDASNAQGVMRLTPSEKRKTGAVWHSIKQQLNEGFSTEFQFRLSNIINGGADGFAFVIQNHDLYAIGGTGGSLGYGIYDFSSHPPYHEGISNSIAIEFDIWDNYEFSDPPAPHISIQTNGVNENTSDHTFSLGASNLEIDLKDGLIHTAKIEYLNSQLSVFVDDMDVAILNIPMDIQSIITLSQNNAYVGFTGATGGSTANQDILSWSFESVPEPTTLLLVGIGAVMMRRRFNS
jgi:hypothetical protein